MDAIVLLREDHKVVERLFKRFEKAGERARTRRRGRSLTKSSSDYTTRLHRGDDLLPDRPRGSATTRPCAGERRGAPRRSVDDIGTRHHRPDRRAVRREDDGPDRKCAPPCQGGRRTSGSCSSLKRYGLKTLQDLGGIGCEAAASRRLDRPALLWPARADHDPTRQSTTTGLGVLAGAKAPAPGTAG